MKRLVSLFGVLLLTCSFQARGLTFEDLVSEVRNPEAPVRTVEDLVCSLPDEHLSNYVKLYSSRSIQEASFEKPRVILYGHDAKLVVAVGGEGLAGGRKVEVSEYQETTRTFRYHEIEFRERGPAIVRRDVKSCRFCHGRFAHPKWDPYSTWPGAFGALDDNITQYPQHWDRYRVTVEGRHLEAFEGLRARQARARIGRYQCLKDLEATYLGTRGEPRLVRPNLMMGEPLERMNVLRFLQVIKDDPSLFPLRFAVLGAITCDVKTFFPQTLRDEMAGVLRTLEADILRTDEAAVAAKLARLTSETGVTSLAGSVRRGAVLATEVQEIASLRLIVDGFSNHHLVDWNNDATAASYDFGNTDGFRGFFGVFSTVFPADARALVQTRGLCEAARTAHLRAFPETETNVARVRRALRLTAGPFARTSVLINPFSRCIQCHLPGNERNAPAIPFERPKVLFHKLRSNADLRAKIQDRLQERPPSGRTRMPPGPPLTEIEREAVAAFFRRLRGSVRESSRPR